MENIREHLIGQYLQEIKKCDFVKYNLQTKFTQGEIDVVAINSNKKEIFICEVATNMETGLQYIKEGRSDNVNRFVNKFTKNIKYSKDNFKDFKCHFMLWTPIIKVPKTTKGKYSQLEDLKKIKDMILKKHNVEIELIYNEKYLNCINELRKKAKNTTSVMTSSIMRFLQIDEKLKNHIEKIR